MYGISKFKFISFLPISRFHTSKGTLDKIVIPTRIQRGPTDILKAIAGTVQRDPTSTAYQYHDDPYLIPITRLDKKLYALSKESGKKAARWVRDKHSDLFNHQPDEPIVKDFLPKPFLDEDAENIEANEETLINFIECSRIPSAIRIFKECKAEELSPTTLQSLLECVCYSNEEEITDPDWIEEIMAKEIDKSSRIKSWKDGGVAEELFGLLKDSGSKPYCALIRGMCKYHQSERAWHLFQEALEKDIPLDAETISHLIDIVPYLREEHIQRWQLIETIVSSMGKMQIAPSISIMNSILAVLATCRLWNKSTDLCLQVLTEFMNFGIEPSLTTFYHTLKIFRNQKRRSQKKILPSILDYLNEKEITARSKFDSLFFGTAMSICLYDHNGWELACKLHRLLQTGHNCNFIGNTRMQSAYYRNYLLLSLQNLPMDSIMKMYEEYIPNVYSPEPQFFNELVKTIGVYDAVEHLPKVWSDIITFGLKSINDTLCEMFLSTLNKHPLEAVAKPLQERFSTIAWDIWTRIQEPTAKRQEDRLKWNIAMLSDCLSILSRCEEDAKVDTVADFIANSFHFSLEDLPIQSVEYLFHSALRLNRFDRCYKCLLVLQGKETSSFKDLVSSLSEVTTLTEEQLKQLHKDPKKTA